MPRGNRQRGLSEVGAHRSPGGVWEEEGARLMDPSSSDISACSHAGPSIPAKISKLCERKAASAGLEEETRQALVQPRGSSAWGG